MIKQTKRKLKTFENRVLKKICGPIIDETTGNWRERYNKELYDIFELAPITSFFKGQRIQWIGRSHNEKRGERSSKSRIGMKNVRKKS